MNATHLTVDISTPNSELEDGMIYPPIDNYDSYVHPVMLDMSSNKKFLAYISRDKASKNECNDTDKDFPENCINVIDNYSDLESAAQYYLTIRSLKEVDSDSSPLHLTRNVTEMFSNHVKNPVVFFLSVSEDGKFISLSCFQKYSSGRSSIIYEVQGNKVKKRKEIKEDEGRGVFLDNGQFIMVNLDFLYIYNRDFSLSKCFSIKELAKNTLHQPKPKYWPLFSGVYTGRMTYSKPDLYESFALLCISKRIKQGVLLFRNQCSLYRFMAYSIGQDLSIVLSYVMPDMIYSRNFKFAAGKSGDALLLYNSNKGCKSHRLLLYNKFSKPMMTQFEFSEDGKYLVLAGIRTGAGRRFQLAAYFEVWDIRHEKIIYALEKELNYKTSPLVHTQVLIHPFILIQENENNNAFADPKMKGFYTTISDQGQLELVSFPLEFKTSLSISYIENNHSIKQEMRRFSLSNRLRDIFDIDVENDSNTMNTNLHFVAQINNIKEIYFKFEYQDEKYCLILTELTAELWNQATCNHVNEKENQMSLAESDYKLIYTRSFQYGPMETGFSTKERWTIQNYEKIVSSDSLHLLEEMKDSIQIVQEKICGRIIVRLVLRRDDTEDIRVEDIYLPLYEKGIRNDGFDAVYRFNYLFEGACQALCYFSQKESFSTMTHALWKKKLNRHAEEIIDESLQEMKASESLYFTTISGNGTLSLLASFKKGRQVLFRIVQIRELRICLYSYRKHLPKKGFERENALTILIEKMSFGLYKLLLNKIIQDTSQMYPRSISLPVTDALILLQKAGFKDLLSKTIKSLDFIPIYDFNLTKCSKPGLYPKFDISIEQELIEDKHSYRNSWATIEQIYPTNLYYQKLLQLLFKKKKTIVNPRTKEQKQMLAEKRAMDLELLKGSYIRPCIVPLVYFNTYLDFPSETDLAVEIDEQLFPQKKSSIFLKMASDRSRYNVFDEGDLIVPLILRYKWIQFASLRFFQVCLIHLVFYTTYFLAVPFSIEKFGYEPGQSSIMENNEHLACTLLCFIFGAILLIQEMRQFWFSPKRYVSSFYNYIDILALVLCLVTFFQLIFGLNYLDEVSSVCTLVIWLHGLLRLRAIQYFGIALEVVIQLFYKVSLIILIMVFVVFAFTNAFIVLLRRKDDSYFQEQYTGNVLFVNSTTTPENDPNIAFVDGGANDFTDVFKAFKDVWFFIYGIWDPINAGDSADNIMSMILAIVFSFIVLLLFFNIVIGFMSASIEEVRQRGRKVWLSHLRDVIAEIEQIWCFEYEKRDRKNNPAYIYYAATSDEIRKQKNKLEEETKYLIEEFKEVFEEK